MKNINFIDKDKSTFIYEIAQIIKTGNDSKKIVNFLEENKEILSEDEYINIKEEKQNIPEGYFAWLMPGYKYSVNIKYTTIIIAAFILDINITKGFASLIRELIGISIQSIKKIEKSERCIIAEIAKRKKLSLDDLFFYKNRCLWNIFDCQYRKEMICMRNNDIVKKVVEKLIKEKILKEKKGILKIVF